VNFVRSKPNASAGKSDSCASCEGGEELQRRLKAKDGWKTRPGHRYSPEELKRMSETAGVTIHRRKRVVMQL